jgi:hypothetical protein
MGQRGGVVRVVEMYSVQRNRTKSDVSVVNCTAGMERKPQKIEVVVAAAEVFGCRRLDTRRVTGWAKWWCPILSG